MTYFFGTNYFILNNHDPHVILTRQGRGVFGFSQVVAPSLETFRYIFILFTVKIHLFFVSISFLIIIIKRKIYCLSLMYNINSFKFVENNLTLYIDGISAVGPFSE
jgi:hypothetical protein